MNVRDLLRGEYSVWRIARDRPHILDLVERLKVTRDAKLFAVVSAKVESVRQIPFASGGRAFCVLDECECNAEKTEKHFLHAHISFCKNAIANELDPTDIDAVQAVRELYMLMKTRPLWKLAA